MLCRLRWTWEGVSGHRACRIRGLGLRVALFLGVGFEKLSRFWGVALGFMPAVSGYRVRVYGA